MALCLDVVMQAADQSGQTIQVSGFKKIKFKQMVLPESEIDIRITPQSADAKGGYSFEVSGAGESVCAGFMTVIPA
jgi:3-hydroxymyristoyl/3-hydroxydecanoyl-(acyl carrier protein) dehydratase